LPEPCEDVLAEVTLGGRQDADWTRRVCRSGEVWEHSNLRTWVEDGVVRQEHVELEWRLVTTAPPDAVADIEAVIERFDLASAAAPSAPTVIGAGLTVWRLGGGHEIRLDNVPADTVPGLRELDQAVQLAVAKGVAPAE
jgi:hypothetical protein